LDAAWALDCAGDPMMKTNANANNTIIDMEVLRIIIFNSSSSSHQIMTL
jgi:hypothetical protein